MGGFGLFVNRRRGEISFACRQRSVTRINCRIIIFLVSVGNKNRRFRKFFVTRRLCVFSVPLDRLWDDYRVLAFLLRLRFCRVFVGRGGCEIFRKIEI